jgi:hypothetical protein
VPDGARPSGLFSFLNIPTRSYVEVEGAHLTRLHQPGRMVARFPSLWLVKKEIVAVLVSGRVELGTTAGATRGYTTVVTHPVHIMLGGMSCWVRSRPAASSTSGRCCSEWPSMFIPVYEGELTAILFPNVRAPPSPAALQADGGRHGPRAARVRIVQLTLPRPLPSPGISLMPPLPPGKGFASTGFTSVVRNHAPGHRSDARKPPGWRNSLPYFVWSCASASVQRRAHLVGDPCQHLGARLIRLGR